MSTLTDMLGALEDAGGDRQALADPSTAHVVAIGHRVLSWRAVPGLAIDAEETPEALVAGIRIERERRIARPVHLCAGVLARSGTQRLRIALRLERGAAATILAHCLFPLGEAVQHLMDAEIDLAEAAELRYVEGHYHGQRGGVHVVPKALVRLGPGARYVSEFTLTRGRVGRLAIDYDVVVGDAAVAELTARVHARGSDDVRIRERLVLAGPGARGLIKTRVALADDATAEVTGITEGHAEGARGHIDCMEIVRDRAVASAVPVVKVTHPGATVTHEAAIGTVDRKQLETLMARGMTPAEAVDLIVGGLLGGAPLPAGAPG